MIGVIFALGAFVALIWYLGLRATLLYGAYLGGSLAHSFGLHWITIVIGAFLGACAVYGIALILGMMSEKRPWLGLVLILFICGPAFLVGFGAVTDYMRSPGQGAAGIESTIVGVIAGLFTAASAFGAYKRDNAEAL